MMLSATQHNSSHSPLHNPSEPNRSAHHYYTYHGLLDPTLNIPLYSHNLKSFCSVYERRFWQKRGRKLDEKHEQSKCVSQNINNNDNNNKDNIKGHNNEQNQTISTSIRCPQVHFINGQIEILESSLTTPKLPSIQSIDEGKEVVVGEERTGYLSFRKKVGRDKWSVGDVRKFYGLLRTFGLDFDAMALTGFRSKKQLKAKYKIENKRNSSLIDSIIRDSSRKKHNSTVINSAINTHRQSVYNSVTNDHNVKNKNESPFITLSFTNEFSDKKLLSKKINNRCNNVSHPDDVSIKLESDFDNFGSGLKNNLTKQPIKDMSTALEDGQTFNDLKSQQSVKVQNKSIPLIPHIHSRSQKTRPRIKPRIKGRIRFNAKR